MIKNALGYFFGRCGIAADFRKQWHTNYRRKRALQLLHYKALNEPVSVRAIP